MKLLLSSVQHKAKILRHRVRNDLTSALILYEISLVNITRRQIGSVFSFWSDTR